MRQLNRRPKEIIGSIARRLCQTAVVAAFCLGGNIIASAEEKEHKPQEATSSLRPFEGDINLQLLSMLAPTRRPDGRNSGSVPITVYFTVPSVDEVNHLCGESHRVRDSILTELYRGPIVKGKHGDLDLDGLGGRLADAINKLFGEEKAVVKAAWVVEGARSMQGGVVSRLPFTSAQGCQAVKDAKKEEKPSGGH